MATAQSIAVPPAMIRYGDIIMLGRPVHNGDLFSRRHPKMARLNRAKLFAPFDALDGFSAQIRKKDRLFDEAAPEKQEGNICIPWEDP
jgi:hypothetical protein